MKKRHLIILIGIIIAALVTAFAFIRPRKSDKEVTELLHLNDTLTNALSEYHELEGMDKKIRKFMTRWDIKGASLAIMRNDSLLYVKGYGWADKEKEREMEPGHILRMESVSK